MNKYQELYELTIKGFLQEGYEVYRKCDWICTLRRWKLVHKTEDIKVIETMINVILDDTEGAEQILVRFSYYDKD